MLNVIMRSNRITSTADDLLRFAHVRAFGTILADPTWQFQNKTGKLAPEHKRRPCICARRLKVGATILI